MTVLVAARRLLADGGSFLADGGNSPSDIDPTTGKGPEWGKAAPIGLLVIVLLCVAVYFLVKSLNRNLKKVPQSFDLVADADRSAVTTPGAAGSGAPGPRAGAADSNSVTDPGPPAPAR